MMRPNESTAEYRERIKRMSRSALLNEIRAVAKSKSGGLGDAIAGVLEIMLRNKLERTPKRARSRR